MKIIIGTDHGGVNLKNSLITFLKEAGYDVIDVGTNSDDSVDYPDITQSLVDEFYNCKSKGQECLGILICKSGIGMSISANKFVGINAALVFDSEQAKSSRSHNHANVLCLGANTINSDIAKEITKSFLETEVELGRHKTRVDKFEDISNLAKTFNVKKVDPEVNKIISNERNRQNSNIELIASENFTSQAVMEAQGSVFTNKYAEGYPKKRWYGGCENCDDLETLAIARVKEIFGCEYVNVQPHSGSQANAAVYFSVLEYGDKILTMDLSHGGHLTHGHPANFSGKFFEVVSYGVDKTTERIDYELLAKLAIDNKPKMITAGASAYPRVIDFKKMREIADSVGAYLFVDMAHIAGLVAAGVHPSPVPHAHFVTSTTHKSLRGPRGGFIMCLEEFGKKIDAAIFPFCQGGPLMHVIAAKAVCFKEALDKSFIDYQNQVVKNADVLSKELANFGFRIISGGTDNHLLLVDLREKSLNGKIAQSTLDKAGITVNKNAIPFDTESPFKAGGIRIGTPAVTSRGMKEDEMKQVAFWIKEALENHDDSEKLSSIYAEVKEFNKKFPLP